MTPYEQKLRIIRKLWIARHMSRGTRETIRCMINGAKELRPPRS